MRNDLTEIALILDKSGSMQGISDDTIGGFNTFITEQKAVPGDANITLFLFDTDVTKVWDGVPIKTVGQLTSEIYSPEGYTALHEAVIKTVDTIGKRLADLPEDQRPGKVIIGIITDGQENSSKQEFTMTRVKEVIEHQQSKYNWQFIFMGANQDSWATGTSMGVIGSNCLYYAATGAGIKGVTQTYSRTVTSLRGSFPSK